MMATKTVPVRDRNVVVLGKSGAGKSTVANNIVGDPSAFTVGDSLDCVTQKATHTQVQFLTASGTQYNLKMVDTVGLFDMKINNKAIIDSVRTYFQKMVPEGVNLVLFVFRKGRYTPEEKETFDYIMKNFRKEISDISALVVTGCEDLEEDEREKTKNEFHTNPTTKELASFVSKGIFTVGFPDLTKVKKKFKADYEADAKKDAQTLRELVCTCSEMRLSEEMFRESFWSRCTIL